MEHKKPPRNAKTLQPNLSLRPLVIGPNRYMTPTLTEPTHAGKKVLAIGQPIIKG